uniref:Uncharacterized protein n=1 Tax=Oncorhynchus mykiss TaxID=8022 RepID=A0A8C7RBK8_ONCMY
MGLFSWKDFGQSKTSRFISSSGYMISAISDPSGIHHAPGRPPRTQKGSLSFYCNILISYRLFILSYLLCVCLRDTMNPLYIHWCGVCKTIKQPLAQTSFTLAQLGLFQSHKASLDRVWLLCCGISTGYGAFGLGALGLGAIVGCKAAGATRTNGIDLNPDNLSGNSNPIQEVLRVAAAGQEILNCPFQLVTGRHTSHLLSTGYKSVESFPKLVSEYMNKKLDEFVTHTLPFESIRGAFGIYTVLTLKQKKHTQQLLITPS